MSILFFIIVSAVFLYFLSVYNYLLFHSLAGIWSVIIAFAVFLFAWNTRKIVRNDYFLFIGISLLSVGVFELIHILSYKGTGIFPGISANSPTQLWVAENYILALSLFIAPIFLKRKLNEYWAILIFLIITILVVLSIFYFNIFPDAYIEGSGLTPFKIYSEYVIALIFLCSIFILKKNKNSFDKDVYRLLILTLIMNFISEFFFTFYVEVYDLSNMIGHVLKLYSFYFIYKSIIEIGLAKPYNLLFKEIEELDKRKDDFLSMASHELKNPISVIKMYSQILERQYFKGTNEYEKSNLTYIRKINNQADRINNLINDLLDVSKIEAGKMVFNMEEFNLDETINQVIVDFQQFCDNHKIILNGKTSAKIKGDKNRIEQVLINLLSNAVKFSPEADRIIVTVKNVMENVLISVQDFGVGIPKEKQDQVFEKYFQTKKGENSGSGLGLGLYISKEIIKRHEGEIWLNSKKDEGTTFFFSLPKIVKMNKEIPKKSRFNIINSKT